MKAIKRIGMLFTVLMLLVLVVSSVAYADGYVVGSGKCGDNLTWAVDSAGVLTISGSGEMYDCTEDYTENGVEYKAFKAPWSGWKPSILKVEIQNGVTSIGEGAFVFCSNLQNVSIPDSVTSIGYMAFGECGSLTSVDIPGSVINIPADSFNGCRKLTSVNISDGVSNIGDGAFAWCSSLSSINIPSTVSNIGSMVLFGCSNLNSLTVSPNNPYYFSENNVIYDTSKSELVACAATVTDVKIPSSVIRLNGGAISHCSSLTSVIIPSSVTYIGDYSLQQCGSLNTVTFQGDAPSFGEYCFNGVTATIYYPAGNSTYTDAVKKKCMGNLTWIAKDEQPELAAPAISSLSNTTSGISVKWNAVEGAAKYKVQYKLSGGSYKTLTTTSSTSCTIAADKLTNGNKYYVRVCSVSTDGTTSSYSSSKSITYAKQYKITYDANGGSGAPSAQTKTYGKTLTLRTDVPTRKGYTFVGWATSASGDVKYQAGGSYTSNSAKTLYAKWTANKYTIKFNGNGKDGGSMSSMTGKKYGTSYTLTANAYTRTGYNFVGWNTKADGSGTSYKDGASVKNLSSKDGGSITLYAQWKLKTYKVSFNANGGTGAPSAKTKTYGKTLTLPTTKPTRSGYTFQGWATSATSTTVKYKAGASYTSNASKTLYAVWKKK